MKPQRVRIAAAHRALLFRQLRLLLGAGVLLADALRNLRDRFPHRPSRRLLALIHLEVAQSRRRFSDALAQFPRTFPATDVAMIAAGEGAGSAELADRLGDLADRIEYESVHRRQLRRACAYPIAVCLLAGGLLCFLIAVVMPRLEDLLRSLGGELPPLTRNVLRAGHAAQTALPATLAAFVAVALAFPLLRRWRPAADRADRLFLALPFFGSLYREFAVALFCKIYRSLYLSNQAAPAILEICMQLSDNGALRAGLRAARVDMLQRGSPLSAALERTALFPPLAILALEVGEESGQLADAMEQVSRHFHARASERLEFAIALINPVLTVLIVLGVGTLMLAFFQALYQVVYAAH
ncbi:MAG TPA: type II secretion system F family protein [Opitutaceae bacterium]|jgi:type II secretory pathway component PulF|nr:type II secretion system F family protein [Opitutaceae bacterium]